MIQTRTVDLERFRNTCGFTATFKCWGNSRKAPVEKIKTEADGDGNKALASAQDTKAKERLKLSKKLIVSEEYDAIKSFFGELRSWTYDHTVPSFFKEGFQLCSNHPEALQALIDKYEKAITTDLPALVDKLIAAYPNQVLTARADLEPAGLFNADDYPDADTLRDSFGIEYHFIAFTVPEGLPPELRATEEAKLQKTFADAGEEITLALRASFQELIAHATEKLTTEPGAKPKIFKDTLIGNILQFMETFENRNLMNDTQLEELVTKAREILTGVTPQKLRDLASVRENTRKQFEQIKTALDGMITVKAQRKFNFSEDGPAAEPTAPTPETTPETSETPQQETEPTTV